MNPAVIEERPIQVAVSVFNFGSVDEKKAHALRLKQVGVDFLHMDATVDEKYTPEEFHQFNDLGMPMQYHPMFNITLADIDALKQTTNLKVIFFHPTMVDDTAAFARGLKERGLSGFAVVAHDTPDELWQNKDHPMYNPELVDGVMCMTVVYGQSGRGFETEWMGKLGEIRKLMHPTQLLWCDGSIKDSTVGEVMAKGVDGVVSASYLLKAEDCGVALKTLKSYDVAIGSDHGGYEMKATVIKHLQSQGKKVRDMGLYKTDYPNVGEGADFKDYPHYAKAVSNEVLKGHAKFGVLPCRSGQGPQMTANRMGARAALARVPKDIEAARRHQNANVVSLGQDFTDLTVACEIVDTLLNTPFDGDNPDGERHKRRVEKIN